MRISGMAKVFGVIGHPVGHSLSPVMHNAAIESLDLDYVYVPFDVPPEKLEAAIEGIRALGIAGVNITVPHKEAVIPFLDELEQEASEIGSVNTVTNLNGKLI
ncbi:MAG TPA: shikimate dehydrogenase, partial [Armatimonadota bacterium]|nr:shikimate dehydrogenase [Armatimonadota bacterium]